MTSIVGPLNFLAPTAEKGSVNGNRVVVRCLLCEDSFQLPDKKEDLLAHLFLQHKFVIADVTQVAILDEYLLFWQKKLNGIGFLYKYLLNISIYVLNFIYICS